MAEARTTTNHDEIKRWAEARGGRPASVKATGNGDGDGDGLSIVRIDFPGGAEESLEDISWEEFFEAFEANNLAFLYQEETASGDESRFFKLVDRS